MTAEVLLLVAGGVALASIAAVLRTARPIARTHTVELVARCGRLQVGLRTTRSVHPGALVPHTPAPTELPRYDHPPMLPREVSW